MRYNIRATQLDLVQRCRDLYKFIDFLDDGRKVVPLDDMSQQMPVYILKATFCKMKADYLRYIYECCHGDNGLFFQDPRPTQPGGYQQYMANRYGEETTLYPIQKDLKENQVKCELCDKDFYADQKGMKKKENAIEEVLDQRTDITFMQFFEHEVFHEYEKEELYFFHKNFKIGNA